MKNTYDYNYYRKWLEWNINNAEKYDNTPLSKKEQEFIISSTNAFKDIKEYSIHKTEEELLEIIQKMIDEVVSSENSEPGYNSACALAYMKLSDMLEGLSYE